jgi:hypothetical protein
VPGLGQLVGERLDADRVVLAVAPQQLGRPSAAGSGQRRQGRCAWRPHCDVGADPGDIAQAQRRDLSAQISVVAVAGIHQHHALRQTRFIGRLNLLKGDLGFGLKLDRVGHPRFREGRLLALSRRSPSLAHSSGKYSR